MTVKVWGVVVVPWVGVPGKVRVDAGLSATLGAEAGGAMAVPESAIACGLPEALSATKRVA